MEAFSDGVIAIIITVMVLELRVPHGADLAALRSVLPHFSAYVLSFVYLGIYWNNHHHMLSVTHRVNGNILWANMHLLFWLSLVPFATGWMGENHSAEVPTATYGAVMLCSALAYIVLQTTIIADQGADGALAQAVGHDKKGRLSIFLYMAAIALAFVRQSISDALYVAVALIWFLPDPRIESRLRS
jgi:uncharacterized membrane protein